MSAASTPRSARFDLPPAPTHSSGSAGNATADSALAEWTNKIKAMQRQVDADEEAEQRRLEEEIVRARLARQRRLRTGQSGDFGVGMHGIDIAKLQEGPSPVISRSLVSDAPRADKQATSSVTIKGDATSGHKRAPISLAEFMGGSASGPRLKRHEPQADAGAAHDGRIEHGSVHPIFGRGGVAMPGMVGKGGGASPAATAASTTAAASSASLPTPSSATLLTTPRLTISDITRPRTTSTLAAARRYVEKLEERAPPQPQALGLSASGVRARRLSTPTGGSPADLRINTPGIASRPLFQNLTGKAVSFDTRTKSPAIETRPKTPTSDLRPKIPAAAEGRPKTPAAADVRPKTPTADTWPETPVVIESRLKTPVNNFRAKTPVEGSRAEAPSGNEHTKTPIQSPTFPNPPSGIASPCPPALVQPKSLCPTTHSPQPQRGGATAFLRAQTGSAKDPTPSISRLQGRGFVQSIVQASQAGTQGTPASVKSIFSSPSPSQVQPQSEARDKSARRASVLDRWQPAVSSSGFSPSGSPRVSSPTRSHTVTPKQGEGIPPVKTHDTGRSVRSTVSMPAIPKTSLKKSDDADEKLGSASTMVTFIKPAKTGDNPLVAGVDELGVKTEGTAGSGAGASDYATGPGAVISTKTPRIIASALPSSPGIPLSHPTRERARKPRKASRFENPNESGPTGRTVVHSGGETQLNKSGSVSRTTMEPLTPGVQSSPIPVNSTSSDHAIGSQSEPASPSKLTPPSKSGRIADRWTEPNLIGVKPSTSPTTTTRPPPSPKPHGMVGRRALPGLTGPSPSAIPQSMRDDVLKVTSTDKAERTVPASPTRSARIPTTGNRALVMDVAQALNDAHQDPALSRPPPSPNLGMVSGLGHGSGTVPLMERRKSSYERYSAIAMPTLKEERTPLPTPAHTLSKATEKEIAQENNLKPSIPATDVGTVSPKEPKVVHIDHVDEPLPRVDVEALLRINSPPTFVPNSDLTTISVEVMNVLHSSVTLIQQDSNILYDTELLTIIYRAKSRQSGLAVTKVWCWRGRKCQYGEREQKKLAELARRYGVSAELVHQQTEPPELVHVLGGKLAIRQGTRGHWSSENTTMHVVRSSIDQILIDEVDLKISNLCSGFSYCVTILDSVYVWYGTGSLHIERLAALDYAKSMTSTGTTVIELTEGEDDAKDEIFWMIVGEPDCYAKADYWRWRNSSVPSEPRCWLIESKNGTMPIRPVPLLSAETILHESVYIIDCVWEFFVLVGKHARGKRNDITLAVNTVITMSKLLATSKPFSPTVHVLIIPTQLPLDMRLAFRNLDELALNDGLIPDHMNILSTEEAIEHLRRSSWEKSALRDHTMLPLGLDASNVPVS